MGHVRAIAVPISDRPWVTEGEAMGMVVVESYLTFRKHYLQKGLEPWRQIGSNKFFLKSDIQNFIETHGKIEGSTRDDDGQGIEGLRARIPIEYEQFLSRPRKKRAQ